VQAARTRDRGICVSLLEEVEREEKKVYIHAMYTNATHFNPSPLHPPLHPIPSAHVHLVPNRRQGIIADTSHRHPRHTKHHAKFSATQLIPSQRPPARTSGLANSAGEGNGQRVGSRGCYLRPRVLVPPTTTRCLPSQLLGASLLRCRITVLLCRRVVMSYHADMMSLFSRRSDSTSAWSSTCCALGQVGWRERGEGGRTEPFSALSVFACASCVRSVSLMSACSWRSWRVVSKKVVK
jgi:hypothetical protein